MNIHSSLKFGVISAQSIRKGNFYRDIPKNEVFQFESAITTMTYPSTMVITGKVQPNNTLKSFSYIVDKNNMIQELEQVYRPVPV
jgi:hypothetical protein